MAWTELTVQRNRRSRTYQDGNQRHWSGGLAALHYESILDSGIHDAEIDATPQRVDVAAFDGWRVTENGWHYALGKDLENHGDEDGWVGFGGRQGQHWFKFRLARVGYLHWPTRAWDDIGGAPNYNRDNLSHDVSARAVGPNEDAVNVESVATWTGIWSTPGGGSLDAVWKVRGDQLKEEIRLNQAGREWIEDNHPPSTPLSETWFGFVFRLDWSDIPAVYRANVLQDIDGDFADDGEIINFRDSLDRLLGFFPLDNVIADSGRFPESVPLRKRFYLDDGNHYLLVGVRCDLLNGMTPGGLVFDPTVNEQVGNSLDDGHEYPENTWNATLAWFGHYTSGDEWLCTRFQTVNVPKDASITVATYTVTEYQDEGYPYWVYAKVRAEAIDTASAPSDSNYPSDMSYTSAGVDLDVYSNDWIVDEETEVTITTVIQEIVNRSGWSANNNINIVILNDGTTGDYDLAIYDYDDSTTKTATLDITYSNLLNISVSDTITVTATPRHYSDLVVVHDSITVSVEEISGDLSISKAESIAASDVATITLSDLAVSVAESVTASDSSTPDIQLETSVLDTTVVADSAIAAMQDLEVGKAESATIADSADIALGAPVIAKSESVTVSDDPSVSISEVGVVSISRAESITVADSSTVTMTDLEVNKAESVTASDNANIQQGLEITKADDITASDLAASNIAVEDSESETVTIADSPTVAMGTMEASASETITVSDNAEASTQEVGVIAISKTDSVIISDAPILALADLTISRAESITAADTPTAETEAIGAFEISVSDTVTVSATPRHYADLVVVRDAVVDISISAPDTDLHISKAESVTVIDSASAELLPLEISKAETIIASDNAYVSTIEVGAIVVSKTEAIIVSDNAIAALTDLEIAKAESVGASDSVVSVSPELDSSIADSVATSDATAQEIALSASVVDTAGVSDAAQLSLADLAVQKSDIVTVSDQVSASLPEIGALVISKAEAVIVHDVASAATEDLTISVADGVTAIGSVGITGVLSVAKTETITIAAVATTAPLEIATQVSDSITTTDSPTVGLFSISISKTETITVSDSAIVSRGEIGALEIVTSDTLLASDLAIAAIPELFASITDAILITDSPLVEPPSAAQLSINTSSDLAISDVVTIEPLAIAANIADSVEVSGRGWPMLPGYDIFVSVSESVDISSVVLLGIISMKLYTRASDYRVTFLTLSDYLATLSVESTDIQTLFVDADDN